MNALLYIEIDLHRVREHLAAEHGRLTPLVEITDWLRDAGFVQQGDGWLVREGDVGHLEPDEVVLVEGWALGAELPEAIAS